MKKICNLKKSWKKILLLALTLVLMGVMGTESTAVNTAMAENITPYININDYGDEVIRLHQKLRDLGYYQLRPESPWNRKSADAISILQENLNIPVTGVVQNKEEYDHYMSIDEVVGKNLAVGSSDQWSEWMSPQYDVVNSCFNVALAELKNKSIGDCYTCSLEIEFKDMRATASDDPEKKFWIRSQGAVDGAWNMENVWNDTLISLRTVPEDGVYGYTAVSRISENNVNAEKFTLGFRCDYWKSGSFRVRNVKVEKGSRVTEWLAN